MNQIKQPMSKTLELCQPRQHICDNNKKTKINNSYHLCVEKRLTRLHFGAFIEQFGQTKKYGGKNEIAIKNFTDLLHAYNQSNPCRIVHAYTEQSFHVRDA